MLIQKTKSKRIKPIAGRDISEESKLVIHRYRLNQELIFKRIGAKESASEIGYCTFGIKFIKLKVR